MKTKKLTNGKQSVITKRDTMTMWYFRFLDLRKEAMMEFGGKNSFNLGLDSKIPRCFLMMRPTSGKFGLYVVTNGNNFFLALASGFYISC